MNLFKNVHESWIPLLYSVAYEEDLLNFLESLTEESFQPEAEEVFRVFKMPVSDIKVVLIGKSPYPMPLFPNGLAYGVVKGNPILPDLIKDLRDKVNTDVKIDTTVNWQTLEQWENQGVFLLNAALTTITGEDNSHKEVWENFTKKIVSYISYMNPCIWMLWGDLYKTYIGSVKNPFIVEGYNEETIKEIPMYLDKNYIFPGLFPGTKVPEGGNQYRGFSYTNVILNKKRLKKITW